MKKIINFIVEKKYLILILCLIFTFISLILSSHVKINYDISLYLPDSTKTKIGMNIMDKEFQSTNMSTLNIMIKDLNSKEKQDNYHYLKNLTGVDEINYDNTAKYNKGNYTLYTLTLSKKADSQTAKNLYKKIEKHYKNMEYETSGDVSDQNKTVLPFYIVALAVSCAIIILIIMCESYIEPFLFLTSILIAIALNDGTNIIFSNVSNITNSISAILQMALSMDYSIMLMNRYQQEKQTEKNKEQAMKNALHNAFTSISSSSITTIVGLLALVFMSFTIGKDLGFVLAKGVLFSLLSIFTCLPALILIFDKLITKTKKKSPTISLDKLGKISYKIRHLAVILFILAFGISYLLKGNLKIAYTESGTDKIDKIFDLNNQIAVIYDNKLEKDIAKYCKSLENKNKVDQVLCYGNTLNDNLTYDKLNNKLNDLGQNIEIEDNLLKILYYYYYNQEENNKLTINELVNYIENTIYKNTQFNNNINPETKNNISTLSNFTNPNMINKKRNSQELANTLKIDESTVNDILVYYNSQNQSTKITLNDLTTFIKNDILTNSKYSKNINQSSQTNLNRISKFTNKALLEKNISPKEMSILLGIPENITTSAYAYYANKHEITQKLTIAQFANYIQKNLLTNPQYNSNFSEDTITNINTLVTFTNPNIITKKMTSPELANLLKLPLDTTNNLFLLIFSTQDNNTQLTIKEFVTMITYLKNKTNYLEGQDVTKILELSNNEALIQSQTQYTATSLANILGIDKNQIFKLYALIDFSQNNTSSWQLTPNEFITFLKANTNNPTLKPYLNESLIANITSLNFIITSTINNETYTYQELSQYLSMPQETTKTVYSLYFAQELSLTPNQFVNFLLANQNDPLLKNNLTKTSINELTLLNKIIKGTLNNKNYSSQELSSLLDFDKNTLDLIYSLYDINHNQKDITISLQDFVTFIRNNLMNNQEYSATFDTTTKNNLNSLATIMNSSLSNIKYNNKEMYTVLSTISNDLDKDLIDLIYIYYGSEHEYNPKWTMTIEHLINFLNTDILKDERFNKIININMQNQIKDAKNTITDAKNMLVGNKYSRIVINTKLKPESKETFKFLKNLNNDLEKISTKAYAIGNSQVAYEMSKTFQNELNFITVLTMIFIFIVVAFTFKSILIPIILVLLIQCAVYLTMGILSLGNGTVYFIALLIVQSILMGATIDYAILYTSYYLESRKTLNIKKSIINSYNNSIHTILTSASILVIVTLIVGNFTSAIASKICKTISEGTLCSTILIIFLLPAVLASIDKFVIKSKKNQG